MNHALRPTLGCVGLALTLALAGCSSSGNGSGGSNTPPSSPSHATSPATPPAPPPTGGAPAGASTKAAVAHAYQIFFNTKTSLSDSVADLQHGDKFRAALNAQSSNPAAKNISAQVTKVQLPSPHVAYVTFDLLSGGSPLLKGTHGYAVQEGGTWKVAAQTFCALLQLQNSAPAACKDMSIIAMPH